MVLNRLLYHVTISDSGIACLNHCIPLRILINLGDGLEQFCCLMSPFPLKSQILKRGASVYFQTSHKNPRIDRSAHFISKK